MLICLLLKLCGDLNLSKKLIKTRLLALVHLNVHIKKDSRSDLHISVCLSANSNRRFRGQTKELK